MEAEKAAVEAAYAAYSAEAAQRVTSLQHKVQTLQSAVDTQSALGASPVGVPPCYVHAC